MQLTAQLKDGLPSKRWVAKKGAKEKKNKE
jgi:hypothetical protein